jgi:hypothetical protein
MAYSGFDTVKKVCEYAGPAVSVSNKPCRRLWTGLWTVVWIFHPEALPVLLDFAVHLAHKRPLPWLDDYS